ncbi:disease resistance protein RGA5-like [Triticum aestivum]|uniref:disease resistance protein RGA5-like n=1 Tax=Triticum aestivum TaxID=4565 RepID=UPI001D011AFF|nr:disease resistance protein RGA5-like [Triticum aestivum]
MAQLLVSSSAGAMGSVLGKLGTMLSDEYKLLKGVHDDIKFLKDELEAMQGFLLMMADVEKPDQQAKVRVNAVREMSYEIEDTIDKFMLLGESDDSSSMFDGFGKVCKKIMKKIADIKTCHKIAKDIHDIKTQVKEISKRYARYMVNEPSRSKNENFDPRIRAIYKDASDLIGVDGPRDEIVKWLCNRDGESTCQLKVVSIVGYGGLGKTTLARQVYDKLRTNYECRAFVSISRSPDMTKIFSSILSQLRNQEFAQPGDLQLTIELIRTFLQHKRYFIIIDDVWDIHTWQGLNCALFRNDRGSVIMTTTRIYDVAKSCCLSYGDHLVYKIQPLGVPDSKKLFFKRIFGCEEKCPSNLKQVSEDILKKCGGLPLAINTISSLLATGKKEEEWYSVRSSIGFAQGTNSDINTMNYILSLSYYDLPLCLRSCLLYLTMFPEDYDIEMERLVHKWISEGFIHGEDGKDLFEIGETYFLELVNRSLIQPIHISYDGASSCRVHDTILDFLIYMSTEENFCMLLSNHSKSVSRVRRLSLMGNEDQESVEKLDLSHVRSLGSFGYHLECLPSLPKLNAHRVLDLCSCNGLRNYHLKCIGRLFQLRYLNISLTNITELPREIGDLEYLETLDASGAELNELPESVTRLKRLARLFVPKQTKFPDAVGNMENLQEFGYSINTFVQSVKFLEELGKLTNLRKLSIQWDTRELEEASCKGEKLVSSLCKMDECKLRNLHILLYLREGDGFVGHPSIPALNSIRSITLGCGRISWIAQWLISLTNLELLVVNGAEMEQQDVNMVGSIEINLLLLCQ